MILICVTISVISAGVGAAELSAIFTVSAKTAAVLASSGAVTGGVMAGAIAGIETHNFDEAIKAGALRASEDFKWGAIIGAVSGGFSETYKLNATNANIKNAVATKDKVKIGKESEKLAQELFKGEVQKSFLNGEPVKYATAGATRPDLVRYENGKMIASEVKNYDLKNQLSSLKDALKTQVENRVQHLPEGSSQEIILITKGRNYTKSFTDGVVKELQEYLFESYSGIIPIKVV